MLYLDLTDLWQHKVDLYLKTNKSLHPYYILKNKGYEVDFNIFFDEDKLKEIKKQMFK